MKLQQLETHQAKYYFVAVAIGGMLGVVGPALGASLEAGIEPVLAFLLYTMFCQIPFLDLRAALAARRFMLGLVVANFVVVPILVWLLIGLLPQQPALLLGVCLVLLTPCIDYVIVFTKLGRGDAGLVLVATPLLLLLQMLLLPLYLWLFLGQTVVELMSAGPFLRAFALLIVVPLALALLTEFWASRYRSGKRWHAATAWWPVPMMALTLLLIFASQIARIQDQLALVATAIPVYIAFLIITPWLARLVAGSLKLETAAGRALVFSASTRNSLVVLPLALGLPEQWRNLVAAVIVTQTLVELVGELIYVRVVPRWVFPDAVAVQRDA